MGRADTQEHLCFLMYYLSRQHAVYLLTSACCMPETPLMLQLLLTQEGAALLKRQDILPCYGRRVNNSNNDQILELCHLFNFAVHFGRRIPKQIDTHFFKQNPVLMDFLVQECSCFLLITMKLNETNRKYVLEVNATGFIFKMGLA